jgi:hypothetical protein
MRTFLTPPVSEGIGPFPVTPPDTWHGKKHGPPPNPDWLRQADSIRGKRAFAPQRIALLRRVIGTIDELIAALEPFYIALARAAPRNTSLR